MEHKYLWQGSKLVSEYYDGKELEFFYDESGNPYAFSYKASSSASPVTYYYLTNLQGDVTGILDSSGNTVAAYTYNAWGNILSTTGTLADVNPLRYRGYYYDSETGLYYLKSRYYDPEVGRFINADSYASTGQGIIGCNMFAYCLNNPIQYSDDEGTLAFPGEIHNEVVKRVARENAFYYEQTITYNIGWGRADLISPNGEVWEVKRDKPRQIERGKTQLEKYVNNTWAKHPEVDLSVGGVIKGGQFPYKSGETTYYVTYRYAGNGVIAYDYRAQTDWNSVVNTVGGIALIGALAYLTIKTGGVTAPALGKAIEMVF